MTVARLLGLLRHHDPEEAHRIATGVEAPPSGSLAQRILADDALRSAWADSTARRPVEATWERCRRLELEVSYLGGEGHPALLVDDPLPPAVLFTKGDRSLL